MGHSRPFDAAEEKRAALFEHSEFAARPQRILRLLAALAVAADGLTRRPASVQIPLLWGIGPKKMEKGQQILLFYW